MIDLWVLHIASLWRTFDQSLMKIFQRVQEIWSGQESITEGQTDGQTDRRTDEGYFYNPLSALRRGIKKPYFNQGSKCSFVMVILDALWSNVSCFGTLLAFTLLTSSFTKKIREKSRECHNHKPQPFPDPKTKPKKYEATSWSVILRSLLKKF